MAFLYPYICISFYNYFYRQPFLHFWFSILQKQTNKQKKHEKIVPNMKSREVNLPRKINSAQKTHIQPLKGKVSYHCISKFYYGCWKELPSFSANTSLGVKFFFPF